MLIRQGAYTFTLLKPVLHAPGDGENDASFALTYQVINDEDEAATGTLNVTVDDDTPIAIAGASASIRVDEDDLDGVLSNDNSTGNTGDPLFNDMTADEATFSNAMLQALVASGADTPITFALNSLVGGPVQTVGGAQVLSQGQPVVYGWDGSAVVGFVQVVGGAGYDVGDRIVFRLSGLVGATLNSICVIRSITPPPQVTPLER